MIGGGSLIIDAVHVSNSHNSHGQLIYYPAAKKKKNNAQATCGQMMIVTARLNVVDRLL